MLWSLISVALNFYNYLRESRQNMSCENTTTDRACLSGGDILPSNFHADEKEIEEFRPYMRYFKFLTPVHKTWRCLNCKVLLLRAWKSSCGHSFCGDCLQSLIVYRGKCPDDGAIISECQFYRDEVIETAVSRTYVICPENCGSAFLAYEIVKHIKSDHHLRSGVAQDSSMACRNKHQVGERMLMEETVLKSVYDRDVKNLKDEVNEKQAQIDNLNAIMQQYLTKEDSANQELSRKNKEISVLKDVLVDVLGNENDASKTKDEVKTCARMLCPSDASSSSSLRQSTDATVDKPCKDGRVIKDFGWAIHDLKDKVEKARNGDKEEPVRSNAIYIDDLRHYVLCELYLNGVNAYCKGKYVSLVVNGFDCNCKCKAAKLVKRIVELSSPIPLISKLVRHTESLTFHGTSASKSYFERLMNKELLDLLLMQQNYLVLNIKFKG